jgi:hypothetical protein
MCEIKILHTEEQVIQLYKFLPWETFLFTHSVHHSIFGRLFLLDIHT